MSKNKYSEAVLLMALDARGLHTDLHGEHGWYSKGVYTVQDLWEYQDAVHERNIEKSKYN